MPDKRTNYTFEEILEYLEQQETEDENTPDVCDITNRHKR